MPAADLQHGEIELTGRITTASNATFLARLDGIPVVYKPVAGERPLWDFPDGDLASREVAAYLVSEAFGWNVVPRTWLRDGPLGSGMVQLWQDVDPEQDAVDLVSTDAVPGEGWRRVFDGTDNADRTVTLIHEDSTALRRMAVFDIVVNNADRKGAHVLAMADGRCRDCRIGGALRPAALRGTVSFPARTNAPDAVAAILNAAAVLSAVGSSARSPA